MRCARWAGHEIRADVRVLASGTETLEETRHIGSAVSARLRERVDHLSEVLVQIEPEPIPRAGLS